MAVTTERCTDGIVKPLPRSGSSIRAEARRCAGRRCATRATLVPTERFFVRNHTSTPIIDPLTYRLELFGRGLRGGPVSFSYDELTRDAVARADRRHRVRR